MELADHVTPNEHPHRIQCHHEMATFSSVANNYNKCLKVTSVPKNQVHPKYQEIREITWSVREIPFEKSSLIMHQIYLIHIMWCINLLPDELIFSSG